MRYLPQQLCDKIGMRQLFVLTLTFTYLPTLSFIEMPLCEDRVTLKFIHKAAYKLKINRFFFVPNWTVTFIPFIYTHHYYFPKDFCLRFKHLFDIKCPTGNFGGWLEIISPVGYIYLFLYLLFFCPGRFLLMCLPSINLLDFHLFELVAVVS